MFRFISLIAALAAMIVPGFAEGKQELTRFTFTEYHMGVDARLVVYAKDQTTAETACTAAFERIAQLDTIMSDYRVNSELMELCRKAGGPPVKVSDDLFKILEISRRVSSQSQGKFDVTISPLVRLWRTARKTGVLPKPEEIEAARKLVGWRYMRLDKRHQTVQLLKPGMLLDLGGVGKGYANDEATKVLKAHGIKSSLVEMGGDLFVTDPPPGKKGWSIEVPNAGGKDMAFSNCAVSSSGDTVQFVIIGGKRYSHVIDPATGYALTQGVQVTVIYNNGTDADAVSKGVEMLTGQARERLLKHYPSMKCYVRVLKD